jgi:anti-anti-sigma factor
MEILEFRKGPVYILGLQGKLDAVNSPLLREKFVSLIDEGETMFLLDCSGLEYISSAGLRVLYEIGYKLEERSGKIALCSMGPQVKKVIDLVDMASDFPVYASREEACNALVK